MSGFHLRPQRSLDDLVRLACSTDPQEAEEHPRRLALAPRAALGLGVVLLALALVLALRTVTGAASGGQGAVPPATSASAAATPDGARSGAVPSIADPAPSSASPASGGQDVVVHVTGAVVSPGVVHLPAGSRVTDALTAAGGPSADADTSQINLARPLADGEQVRVPRAGEDASAWDAQAPTAATGTPGASPGQGQVNINTADAGELERLPGIGPALAQRIVDYRREHGRFGAVEDLTDVPGIGPAKLRALKEVATV